MQTEGTAIKQVKLKVKNLDNMILFYTKNIGLVLINKKGNTAYLGAQQSAEPLLVLEEVEASYIEQGITGLFHIAFLLPTRKDLGNMLLWLLKNEVPLEGASDHGYSEAIYLVDPEQNGIEIYRDKPVSEWDIRDTGEIIGITEEMDAEGVIAAADGQWLGVSPGSIIGHIHLKVSELEQTEEFYKELLGFDLKANFGRQAKFFATGMYHHQIGTNTWGGKHLPATAQNQTGLDYFVIEYLEKDQFDQVLKKLTARNKRFEKDGEQIKLTDPNGIKLVLSYK